MFGTATITLGIGPHSNNNKPISNAPDASVTGPEARKVVIAIIVIMMNSMETGQVTLLRRTLACSP